MSFHSKGELMVIDWSVFGGLKLVESGLASKPAVMPDKTVKTEQKSVSNKHIWLLLCFDSVPCLLSRMP